MDYVSETALEVAPIAVETPRLRQIPENENFKRKDDLIDADHIRVTFAIRADQSSPRYEKSVLFDFTGVSPEQRMLLACTNGVVVWVQRMLRDLGDGLVDPKNFAEVNVLSDVIEGPGRVVADPLQRAKNALNRLDPELRAALLAEMSQ